MDPLSPTSNAWSTSPPPPLPQSTSSPSSSSHLPPSTSPARPTPTQQPSFREPKVFGDPGVGLISPDGASKSSGGGGGASAGPFLRVRIGGLERNKKDLLVRFDASTNLPNFRTSMYRNMQRSYVEFQRFAEQAQATSPQTIIPALPLPSTSAMTDEEDDRLVRIALQRWFTRICEDPVLLKDDELRSFIESDFGYQPVPPPSARRPTSATSTATNVLSAALSKVVRRGPSDEDDELQIAKGALEKLEGGWGNAAVGINNLGKTRRAHALANQDVGAKLISLSTVESDPHLANAERKMGRSLEQLAGMAGAQAASENVVLSDSLGYQALNARSAKDALAQRTQILEDAQQATKSAINKRRQVERLKGSSSINPGKVDDAISEMDEANALEQRLNTNLSAISQNLHLALRSHSRHAHDDVALALLENARLTVGFHKHVLRELEALRPDLARIGSTALAGPASSAHATPTRVAPPSQPAMGGTMTTPSMVPPNPYASPTRAAPPPMDGSKSMFLPPPPQRPPQPTPTAVQGQGQGRPQDPLGGASTMSMTGGGGMAQSMMLPGQQAQRAQTLGRQQGRRLDERQAARMLAGGF